ncbi:MAG TPA: VWA domain-containing protein, partial [Firmicutes bacterium]|nr:VWA domain-containing protein [Bacillota bacterium]
ISLDEFLTIELFVHHLPEDPRGYFMVRIRPNEKSQALPVMSKDLIFVLDASASMGQRTMAALRTGIKLGLSKLKPEDRFNVVGFKRTVARFRPALVPANPENIQAALRFVDGLEPSGRTDIYGSLEPISKQARGGDHPFIILLFSDGRPNVGVVNSRTIINNLTANVRANTSIFAFGASQPMNRYLLDLLSYRNKGFVRFATDFSTTVGQIAEMIEALSDPLLINLSGDYGNIGKEDIYPKTLPDLYRGGEILIYGRYGQEEKFSLRIVGEARGQQKEYIIDLPFPDEDNGPDNLPQLWAFRKIYDLIGRMCQEGETPERLAEIQRISRTYDVRTPYYE